MAHARILTLAIALLVPGAALGEEPPAAAGVEHRLSPEEIAQVLEEAARKREGAGAGPVQDSGSSERASTPLPVHGEVGFSIGTNGYRSAYGTAVVGLPGNGQAIISLGTRRLPREAYYYPDWHE